MDDQCLMNVNEGYQFFVTWIDVLYKQGKHHVCCAHIHTVNKIVLIVFCLPFVSFFHKDPSFCATSSQQKKFLSWQSKFALNVYIQLRI